MNDDLKKLNSIIKNIENNETLTESTKQIDEVGSIAGKLIPGVGLGLGAYDAYKRAKAGDWTGAALSGAGGVASLIPGIGTAASLGLTGIQAGRDKARTGSFLPSDEEIAAAAQPQTQVAQNTQQTTAAPLKMPAAQQGPEVLALQKQLIAKGAKITADGVMGPQTMAAMKQFGTTQLAGLINKGTPMTESEKIIALQERLRQIDEGPLDAAKTIWKGAKWGATHPDLASTLKAKDGITSKLATGAAKSTGAIARNPVKSTAAAGAAGIGIGQMGGASAENTPEDQQPLSASEKVELEKLSRELANNRDPEIQQLLQKYQASKGGVGQQIGGIIGTGVKAPARFVGDIAKGFWKA